VNEQQPAERPAPDSRRRAVIGLLLVVLLVVGGLLLWGVLKNLGKLQDCVLSGRTNCVPIDASTPGSP
jgi:ferric-dicitrate binding protein FerR (iron transport regulator)